MEVFKECQIYTLQELNDKKNLKNINTHCVINSLKFFFYTEDLLRVYSSFHILLLKLISKDIYTPKNVFLRLSIIMNEAIALYEAVIIKLLKLVPDFEEPMNLINEVKYENKQWMNIVSSEECVVEKFTLEAIMKTHQLEIGSALSFSHV